MKNLILLLSIASFLFLFFHRSAFAVTSSSGEARSIRVQFEEIIESSSRLFSTEKFEEIKGRKPKFIEKATLKIASKKMNKKLKRLKKRVLRYSADGCELMILGNGDELEVKILGITESEFQYEVCGSHDKKILSVDKSDVFVVKGKNRNTSFVNEAGNPVLHDFFIEIANPSSDNDNEFRGTYIVGFIAGIILGLLGALIGLFYKKGPKRNRFFTGWATGFTILLSLLMLLYL